MHAIHSASVTNILITIGSQCRFWQTGDRWLWLSLPFFCTRLTQIHAAKILKRQIFFKSFSSPADQPSSGSQQLTIVKMLEGGRESYICKHIVLNNLNCSNSQPFLHKTPFLILGDFVCTLCATPKSLFFKTSQILTWEAH